MIIEKENLLKQKVSEHRTFINSIGVFQQNFIPKNISTNNDNLSVFPYAVLSYDQNDLTFSFSAIDLAYPEEIRFRYYLKGYDKDWLPITNLGISKYTNLDPGKYTLMLQATDDTSVWSSPVTEYNFLITKPFWEMPWFYMLQLFFLASLFFITYAISQKSSRRRHRIIIRILVYSFLFILFEYVENFFDPFTSSFVGGVPIQNLH